jgi:hypothetical protein
MREIIQKAISAGVEFKELKTWNWEDVKLERVSQHEDNVTVFFSYKNPIKGYPRGKHHESINFYALLFNKKLGFVEALVGEDNICVLCCKIPCICEYRTGMAIQRAMMPAADYHRSKLVLLDSIDDMVESLRRMRDEMFDREEVVS